MAPCQSARVLCLLVAVVLAAAFGSPHLVLGRTITVRNLADDGPGSLRHAIAGSVDGDRIVFDVSGIIVLQSTLEITRSVSIAGPSYPELGAPRVVVSGGDRVPVLTVGVEADVSLENLAVADGRNTGLNVNGGGIANRGTLTLSRCHVRDNATSGSGGGMYNTGRMAVESSLIADNWARSGGGIYSAGGASSRVSDSRIEGNSADPERYGTGGGIYGWGPLVEIEHSVIIANEAEHGGGLYLRGHETSQSGLIQSSSIVLNTAWTGGGIYFARGGIATVANSTIADNTASVGAGILTDGRLTLVNCTVAHNSAEEGQVGGVLGRGQLVGGVYVPPVLINTIVSDNTGGNCSEPASDGGHNLQHPGYDCGTAIASRNPLLGVLAIADRSPARAPEQQSPAIGSADPVACSIAPVLGVDQRGMSRPTGGEGGCDIGAIEVGSGTTPTPGFQPAVTPTPPPPDLAPDPIMSVSLKHPFTCYWPDMMWGTYAWVHNYGGTDAGPFAVELEGVRKRLAGLAAHDTASLFFESGYGGPGLWFIADVEDEVVEEYEDNNMVEGAAAVPTLPVWCTATPGPSPTATPTPVVVGRVDLDADAEPSSCDSVTVTGVYSATSNLARVTEMRTSLDPHESCHASDERVAGAAWKSYIGRAEYTITGGPIYYQAALGAQFRDAAGNLSPVYCAVDSGECPRTATPTATASPTPVATASSTPTPTSTGDPTAEIPPSTPTSTATPTAERPSGSLLLPWLRQYRTEPGF